MRLLTSSISIILLITIFDFESFSQIPFPYYNNNTKNHSNKNKAYSVEEVEKIIQEIQKVLNSGSQDISKITSELEKNSNTSKGDTKQDQNFSTELTTSLNYLSTGPNGVQSLAPSFFYGWTAPLIFVSKKRRNDYLNDKSTPKVKPKIREIDSLVIFARLGPLLSAPLSINSEQDLLPALMSNGPLNLVGQIYGDVFFLKRSLRVIVGTGFNLKLINNILKTDKGIIQHGITFSPAFQFRDLLFLSTEWTLGSHSSTYASKQNFTELFKQTNNSVKYFNLTLQTKVIEFPSDNENHPKIYFNISYKKYIGTSVLGSLPNDSIFSIGISNSIGLK